MFTDVFAQILRHARFTGNPCAGVYDSSPHKLIIESVVSVFALHFGWAGTGNASKMRFMRSFARFASSLEPFDNDQAIVFVKGWTEYFTALVFRDESSLVRPEGRSPFFGWFWECIHRACSSRPGSRRHPPFVSFAFSLLNAKRLWPPLSESVVADKLEAHRVLLSVSPPEVSPDAMAWVSLSARVLCCYGIDGSADPDRLPVGLSALSTHASYQSKISIGGTRAEVVGTSDRTSIGFNESWTDALDNPVESKTRELRSDVYLDGFVNAGHAPDHLQSLHLQHLAIAAKRAAYDAARIRAESESASMHFARVIPLLEPGKVRIITAHDGHLQTHVQPYTEELLRIWARHPFSTMLMDDGAWVDWSSTCSAELYGDRFALSGDYSAATDRQNILTAVRCWQEFCVGLNFPISVFESGVRLLMGCVLHYPKTIKIPVRDRNGRQVVDALGRPVFKTRRLQEFSRQLNGCTMGNRISFVQLCVTNSSTVLATRPEFFGTISDLVDDVMARRKPLSALDRFIREAFPTARVNGDDIAMILARRAFELWKSQAASCGFTLSPGKNYLSSSVIMINSKLFDLSMGGYQIGYVNFKLISGRSVKTGDSTALAAEKSQSINQLLKICEVVRPELPAIMRNAGQFLPGADWFVPVQFGGCGIDPALRTQLVKKPLNFWQRCLFEAALRDPSLHLAYSGESTTMSRPPALRLAAPTRCGPRAHYFAWPNCGIAPRYAVHHGDKNADLVELLFAPIQRRASVLVGRGYSVAESDEITDDKLLTLLGAIDLAARERAWSAADGQLTSLWASLEPLEARPDRKVMTADRARDRWLRKARDIKEPLSEDKLHKWASESFLLYPPAPRVPSLDLSVKQRRVDPSLVDWTAPSVVVDRESPTWRS